MDKSRIFTIRAFGDNSTDYIGVLEAWIQDKYRVLSLPELKVGDVVRVFARMPWTEARVVEVMAGVGVRFLRPSADKDGVLDNEDFVHAFREHEGERYLVWREGKNGR